MTDASRRDVLETLAGAVALPAVPDVDLEEVVNGGELPDIPESDPFWIVLYAALHSDQQTVFGDLDAAIVTLAPHEMASDVAAKHVRASARGEYDEGIVQQRAARAWEYHRR